MAGRASIADATVQGAAAAASGAQTAASGVVDATSRGLSVASEGGRRAMEFGRKMLAKISAGPATLYDKAMDAEYLATSIGGGNHRMFDGGHTLAGAFEAVRGASAEDTILQGAELGQR